eukprot:143373_1
MITPSQPFQPRMNIILLMIAVRSIRKIHWMFVLCRNNVDILGLGIPFLAVVVSGILLDLVATGCTLRNSKKRWENTDYIGIGCFVVGSLIESGYDIMRNSFIKDANNTGKPYLGGFAHFVVHPNYFGFMLWRSGMFMLSANIYTAIISIGIYWIIIAFYVFLHV